MSVSTSLRSSIGTVIRVISCCGRKTSIIFNMQQRHGASAFFGGRATRVFCGLVQAVNKRVICGRTSFHLVDGHSLGTLISFPRHGLFLQNVIYVLKCPATSICCSHGRHFTNRSGCPFAGVLGFTLSKVASFSIGPLHLVAASKLVFVLISFLTVVCTLIRFVNKSMVQN